MLSAKVNHLRGCRLCFVLLSSVICSSELKAVLFGCEDGSAFPTPCDPPLGPCLPLILEQSGNTDVNVGKNPMTRVCPSVLVICCLRWVHPWCHGAGQPAAFTSVQLSRISDVTWWCSYFMWLLLWELPDFPGWRRKWENRAPKQVLSASFLQSDRMPSSALLCNEAERPWGNFSCLVCM